jgi:2-polyprenyl-3-methyl-5-hydroxy-6-metoxy-1,4-benzoquinol methylase
MIDGKNFNTRENWDQSLLDLQNDLHWLNRRKDWGEIARESPVINEIATVIEKYAPSAKTLLEIGPGDGYVIFGLSNRIKTVDITAMDISRVSLDMTVSATPGTRTILSSMEEMDLGEKFDIILTAQTLEHCTDIVNVLDRIKKHLNPNGILIAIIPYCWPIDKQHNYVFDNSFVLMLSKIVGTMEFYDTSVQYQSKIVVVRNAL